MARRLLLVGLFAYAKCEKHLDGFKIGTRLPDLTGPAHSVAAAVEYVSSLVVLLC